jgi:hypothetical protein
MFSPDARDEEEEEEDILLCNDNTSKDVSGNGGS